MRMNSNLAIIISAYILTCLQYLFFYESPIVIVVVQAFQGTTGILVTQRGVPNSVYGTSSVLHKHENLYHPRQQKVLLYDTTNTGTSSSMTTEIEQFLQQEHSMFYALLLDKNEHVWKMIRDTTTTTTGACTIFAPTNVAFQALGDTKIQQLQDNRNEEVRNKMGSYHILLDTDSMAEVVTTEQLYNSGGIWTIATGDNPIVPVERTKRSGGNIFASLFQKENDNDGDGTVTLGSNNARIINSVYLKNSNTLIHQMDALISPNILWRYCDQLRIPGSK